MQQFERLLAKAKELHEEQKIEAQPMSPSIGAPLLEAAAMETREEIVELWVRLLAAAMDPNRANDVRLQFVEDLKRLAPTDALVLRDFTSIGYVQSPHTMRGVLATKLQRRETDIEVSFQNLVDTGYAALSGEAVPSSIPRVHPTAKAHEIRRVLGF